VRILSITAGAAGMYCGSCFRDNALAAELIRLGHDVLLLPLYTPTRTDESNVSAEKVFFGGISVYLQQKLPLLRRTPRWLDRLFDAPLLLRLVSRRAVEVAPAELGELTVSVLEGDAGPQRKELAKLLDWLRREPLPDVVSLPHTLLIALARPLKEALGRPVCCAIQGEDLFVDGLPAPYRARALELIRSRAADVDLFLPTSEFYAWSMSAYLGIPREGMRVAPVGINLQGHEFVPRRHATPFRVGYMARIAPEKGLHVLCRALRELCRRHGPERFQIEAAGYLAPEHRRYLAGIRQELGDARLHYHGEVDRAGKIRLLQSIDALSVPCTFDEPKGLYVLEAMANGVPVVQPRRGAFPEIIEKTGGGLLVEPDNPEALADGIESLAADQALAGGLGRCGHEGVQRHYSAHRMAARVLEIFSELTASSPR
jgi:glycosyltransferase involved in cell wall biosynthesis